MEVRLTLQELAEIGSHGFPRVSCYGQYDSQAGNGRKWSKMAENGSHGFPRVSCYGHRGEQVDNGRKWPKMVEKWSKKVHRGYLVENGFSRVLRLFPTTMMLFY